MRECWCGCGGMVEPLEERAEGEEALVEGPHYFGVGEGGFCGDFTVTWSIIASGGVKSWVIFTVVQVVTIPPLT
jgi:hypothetical protein